MFFVLYIRLAVVTALLAAGPPATVSGCDTDQARLMAAHTLLIQNYKGVKARMGADQAALLAQRLDTDVGECVAPEPPPGFDLGDWMTRLHGVAALDASLVQQVASGELLQVEGTSGLAERLFESPVDHTLQPFALYVPHPLPPNPTLVVLLHGNPQTEAEILSMPYFRSLADSTGTIVAAPWARGIAGYFPPADADVYQVTSVVQAAFHIPNDRTYLAGYSNGGYAVFRVGPKRPGVWHAILCISGAIVNGETAEVERTFYGKRVYVVNGSADIDVPADYGARTAWWLSSVGIQTGFYQQPAGTHALPTILPALTRAWHDMLSDRIDPAALAAAGSNGADGPPREQPLDIQLPRQSPVRTSALFER